jgi:peptidylprolyl isomerase
VRVLECRSRFIVKCGRVEWIEMKSGMFKKVSIILIGMLCLGILLLAGCGKEKVEVVENGDSVKVDYTGTLSDGTVFDSSIGKSPLGFTVGAGQMIAGFDKAVVGMKVGQTKKVTIPADEAYGQRNEAMTAVVPKTELPSGMNPKVGDKLQMQTSSGTLVVTVTAVTDTTITIDGNHELAGKDLTFEITLVELTKKTK